MRLETYFTNRRTQTSEYCALLDRNDPPRFAGSELDPLAALVFCAPVRADLVLVHGRVVIRDGQLTTVDLPNVLERHRDLSRTLVRGD